MNRLILACLLAALVGCISHIGVPVVEASPQLQAHSAQQAAPRPSPKPFEGALVAIDVLRGPANLDCIQCRATMRAGRALVRLLRLGPDGELEPCGDAFAALVSKEFEPNGLGYGCITRYTSYNDQPHQILSHLLDESTGTFKRDIVEISWALVTNKQ